MNEQYEYEKTAHGAEPIIWKFPDNGDYMGQTMPEAAAYPPAGPYPADSFYPAAHGGINAAPGFLRSQTGKLMRVEFLVGDQMVDRVGRLLAVGEDYIVLQSVDNSGVVMCDLPSVRFASIINSSVTPIMIM